MTTGLPHQSYIAWKACMAILHIVAVAVSAFRIWLRYRSSRMWWDDYLVVVPVLLDIIFCVVLLAIPPAGQTMQFNSQSTNFWLILFPGFSVTWFSRICFLLLLARLFPARHVYRTTTLVLTVIFSLIYITLTGLTIPRCDGIHVFPPPNRFGQKNCTIPSGISVTVLVALITDLISDLILVIWPFLMLYNVKLSRPKDRPLLIVSLGSSIFTSLLIVIIFIFTYAPITKDASYSIVLTMLAHMTAAVSLIVCNMPVVACAAYRAYQRARSIPQGTVIEMTDLTVTTPASGKSVPGYRDYSSSRTQSERLSASGSTRLTYPELTQISMSVNLDD